MTKNWKADGLVGKQVAYAGNYKRNFLKQAICELRFPTLIELGEKKPPAKLVHAFRKDYPHLELSNQVTIGMGPEAEYTHTHIFRSKTLQWIVAISQNSITIETASYTTYEAMRARILDAVNAALPFIDSDFFTRVGLRYINLITPEKDLTAEWVNGKLLHPIIDGNFRGVAEYAAKIHLREEDGGCLIQHGMQLENNGNKASIPQYQIDIDSYRTNIMCDELSDAIDKINLQAFSVFDWTLGDKAREYLEGKE